MISNDAFLDSYKRLFDEVDKIGKLNSDLVYDFGGDSALSGAIMIVAREVGHFVPTPVEFMMETQEIRIAVQVGVN